MKVAFLNGHTRQGALSADIVSAATVVADTLQTGLLAANAADYDTLTVNVLATLAGNVTFAAAATLAGATFAGPVVFQDSVTVDAGAAVAINSPTTFDADVDVAAGHTLTVDGVVLSGGGGTLTVAGRVESTDATYTGDLEATTISGNPTFTDGATVAAGQTLTVSSAFIAGNPTFLNGLTLTGGSTLAFSGGGVVSGTPTFSGTSTVFTGTTLAMAGASIAGNPAFLNGLSISAGQTLTLTGASIAGTPALTGGATVSPGQTLTFTGATLAGGGTGAITGLGTLNGVPATVAVHTGFGTPQRPTNAFPRMTVQAAGNGLYVIDEVSFSGQASNGTDPGTPRGGSVATAAAQITEVDAFGYGLLQFWVFNRTPYTFYFAGPGILNSDEQSPSGAVWWPITMAKFSRSTAPSPGDYTGWRVETQPLAFVSGWSIQSTALLTSADCTFSHFRHHYGVSACKPSGDALGVRLWGQVIITFALAAPTDPVRITVPLPVGPNATVYQAALAMPNNNEFIADWVMSNSYHPGSRPLIVGIGNMGANGSFTYDDATARVVFFVEPNAAGAGNATLVISGFTGGAGTYWASCPFEIALDNVQYRATYATF